MTKKVILVLCILWTIVCGCSLIAYFTRSSVSTDGLTRMQTEVVSGDDVYIGDNPFGHGVIYKLNKDGELQDSLLARNSKLLRTYTLTDLVFNQTIYALFANEAIYDGKDVTAYKLVKLGENLSVAEISDYLLLSEGVHVTELSYDGDRFYLTVLNDKRNELFVYEISNDVLHELPEGKGFDVGGLFDTFTTGSTPNFQKAPVEAEKFSVIDPVRHEIADAGRRFSDASYQPGKLIYRYDNEKMDSRFQPDPVAKKAYEKYTISSAMHHKQRGLSFAVILLIWGIGIPVIILFAVIFTNRSYMSYVGLMLEILIFVLLGVGVVTLYNIKAKTIEQEYVRFNYATLNRVFQDLDLSEAANALALYDVTLTDEELKAKRELFYDTAICEDMASDLSDAVALTGAGKGMTDICVAERLTGEVLLSDALENADHVDHLYGKTAGSAVMIATTGSQVKEYEVERDGRTLTILTKSLDSAGLPGFSLLAVCDYDQQTLDLMVENDFKYVKLALLLYLIVSVIVIVVLSLQKREIRAVSTMLKGLAEGRGDIRKPRVHGRDMISMKNSVYEIEKNIINVNRAKYMLFEAYYRFAPKSVEVMLGKDSITEVETGDTASLTGTMAILSMRDRKRTDSKSLASINHVFSLMEEAREECGGIFISNNETLSAARVLFPESEQRSVSFGIHFLNSLREWTRRDYTDTFVLMHYSRFDYGVVGTVSQSMAFLSSQETECLAGYAAFLRSLRLSLVVTGAVLEREKNVGDYRYIGFVTAPGNIRIELYEVFGGDGLRVRNAKMKTKTAFEAALQSYYSKDFYLARNAFTDILREFPEDELVKWYLFECEKRLNSENGAFDSNGAIYIS